MASDLELLEAWGAGDQAAARELFERYFHPLYRFFRNKVGNGVEDLMQDTLVACIATRDRFRGEASFRTYLFGIARNVLLKHLRDRYRAGGELDAELESVAGLDPSPSSYAATKAEHRLLLEALRRLPIELQVLLELYHFERMTAVELAALHGVTEIALRGRLHRGKAHLRTTMEQIAASPNLVRSTWADFDEWARELRHSSPHPTPK